MTSYYVNTFAQTGTHELHRYGCPYLPSEEHRTYLGDFLLCRMALNEAARMFVRVNGCAHCVPELSSSSS